MDVVQRRCGLHLHSDLVFDIDRLSATSSIGILPPLAGAIKMRVHCLDDGCTSIAAIADFILGMAPTRYDPFCINWVHCA